MSIISVLKASDEASGSARKNSKPYKIENGNEKMGKTMWCISW